MSFIQDAENLLRSQPDKEFTAQDVEQATKYPNGLSTVRQTLQELTKRGAVRRVKRGIYKSVEIAVRKQPLSWKILAYFNEHLGQAWSAGRVAVALNEDEAKVRKSINNLAQAGKLFRGSEKRTWSLQDPRKTEPEVQEAMSRISQKLANQEHVSLMVDAILKCDGRVEAKVAFDEAIRRLEAFRV